MAWGFWSASTVSDRGRSPRRITTTSSTLHYQSHQPQYTIAMNKSIQQEEKSNFHMTMIPTPQQQQNQQQQQQPKQSAMNSVCGSPCQSTCHSPTCNSPSCSGTTGKKKKINENS